MYIYELLDILSSLSIKVSNNSFDISQHIAS